MITIEPYRARWVQEFQEIGNGLRGALGALALRVDHIGSTSVPGLAAKDIIDVQITVASLDEAVERAIVGAGYLRVERVSGDHVPAGSGEDASAFRKWLFKPAAGSRPVNVHVRLPGRPNQRYAILFRDYLRAHPAMAAAYAQVKLVLARLHPDDIEAYCDIKDPVCDLIAGAAEAWAKEIAWAPGPPDA